VTVEQILKSTFGFDAFRGVQEQVVSRVIVGEPTLAVMPTGAGKSLCYQLPALVRDGTAQCLAADRADATRSARPTRSDRAASLTSADGDRGAVIERFSGPSTCAMQPEQATTDAFRQLAEHARLALIAIDEAHYVSEWGHDFRPDPINSALLNDHEDVPRLALTATDARTRADILSSLASSGRAGGSRLRPAEHPLPCAAARRHRRPARHGRQPSRPRIVYAPSRDKAEKIAEQLTGSGRPACYHAGLEPQVRSAASGVRAVGRYGDGGDGRLQDGHRQARRALRHHAGIPKSIEAYYQEAGRAGRTASRPRPGCSGPRTISPGRGGGSRPRSGRARALERERLNALADSSKPRPPGDPAPPFRRSRARPVRKLR
jgi:ATP-dependent DNA helicase RecQ